jgi:hypothetical protein
VFWRLGFPLPLFDLTRQLLAAGICGAAARGVLILSGGVGSLGLAIAAGIVSYGIAVRLLRALHPQDAARLKNLCGVLPAATRSFARLVIDLLTPGPHPRLAVVAALHRSRGDAD